MLNFTGEIDRSHDLLNGQMPSPSHLLLGIILKGNIMKKERNYKHGASNTPIYHKWQKIKARCYNENCWAYKWYGGSGIKMYDAWINDFNAFYKYVQSLSDYPGNKVNNYKITLDRIDNKKGYIPGNLRFATMHEQCTNRRLRKDNSSGYTGVYKYKNKYTAHIRINGTGINLGHYKTKEEAKEARNQYIIDNGLTEYRIQ